MYVCFIFILTFLPDVCVVGVHHTMPLVMVAPFFTPHNTSCHLLMRVAYTWSTLIEVHLDLDVVHLVY